MEKALIQQNRHWTKDTYHGLYNRNCLENLIKKNSLKELQILLGVRRSGKSTLFKLMINHLIEYVPAEEILNINFDDPYFSFVYNEPEKIYSIIETSEKITKTTCKYLFLDEIQNITGWEKFVKSVYDSEVFNKIFITGSNSSLLKSEYAKLLSGRYLIEHVYPFSFNEVLKSAGINNYLELLDKKGPVLDLLDSVLEHGTYPEIIKCKDNELKREIILNYYETIILKDCIANGNVRDIKTFKELTNYAISNAASLFSYNGIAKAINSNDSTVKDFINILENSYLLKEIKTFSFSLKKQMRYLKKLYCVDNGFLANVSFRFSSNSGKLFENLVFSEFIKKGDEMYFFNEDFECDFIIKKNNELWAFQVCYELDAHNRKRELHGLEKVMKKLNISTGNIITYNQEEQLDCVNVIPFWKWACGFE